MNAFITMKMQEVANIGKETVMPLLLIHHDFGKTYKVISIMLNIFSIMENI